MVMGILLAYTGTCSLPYYPMAFYFLTVPYGELMDIFAETASSTKWLIIMFGILWRIGGLTFELSARYLGIGLGQSVALGFTLPLEH